MRMSIFFSVSHCISIRHSISTSRVLRVISGILRRFLWVGMELTTWQFIQTVHSHNARTGKYIININGTPH